MPTKARWKRTNLIAVIILFALAVFAVGYYISVKLHEYTVLLVFNGNYDVEAENLLASIKKNSPNLLPHINVCVSDNSSKAFAKRHKLKWFELSTIEAYGDFASNEFNIMMGRKIEAILYLLRNNVNVLYMDTDVVLLGNPMDFINTSYDISFQPDSCNQNNKPNMMCAGFMYIKANKRTIAFFNRVLEMTHADDFRQGDQWYIHQILKSLKNNRKAKSDYQVSTYALDKCKFQNGCRYFDHSDPDCKPEDAIMIHNNYIIGIDRKMRRFYENDLIFN